MHRHCGLNKWQIWEYTLPQVTELMKQANKFVEFEIELALAPAKALGASMGADFSTSGGESKQSSSNDDDEYQDLTEDDLPMLMRALGG